MLFWRYMQETDPASWAGAAASFLAVLVALGIALLGATRDSRRRRDEADAEASAATIALFHAGQALEIIFDHEARTEANVGADRRGLLSGLESASSCVEYALRRNFSDPPILAIALNFQALIGLMRNEFALGEGRYLELKQYEHHIALVEPNFRRASETLRRRIASTYGTEALDRSA